MNKMKLKKIIKLIQNNEFNKMYRKVFFFLILMYKMRNNFFRNLKKHKKIITLQRFETRRVC